LEKLIEMYYRSLGRNANLMIGAAPNRDGLIPEKDMQRYKEFGNEIRRRFSRPLASIFRKDNKIELNLEKHTQFNHLVLMEDLKLGERVREYLVEAWTSDNNWEKICVGISIGHKRIHKFRTIKTNKLRLKITKAIAEPIIRKFKIYSV
jgi:alpha-L-fucosidase